MLQQYAFATRLRPQLIAKPVILTGDAGRRDDRSVTATLISQFAMMARERAAKRTA